MLRETQGICGREVRCTHLGARVLPANSRRYLVENPVGASSTFERVAQYRPHVLPKLLTVSGGEGGIRTGLVLSFL